jgi:deoxyribonuclease-4
MTTHIIGGHPPDTGGLHMAVRRGAAAGMRALQIFSAVPKFYGDRSSIRPDRAERFRAELAETGIAPAHVMVHAAYVLNPATSDADRWERSVAGLAKELERSTRLGAGAICFHPGNSGGGNREEACARVAQAIVRALEAVETGTRLLIENTAGAGNAVGNMAGEIGAMLAAVPPRLRARTGYGLDTCHLFAAGYDITASPAALAAVLDEFESATGEPPAFFHLNDSEGVLGSRRDRHRLIGEGAIGAEPFRWLLSDRRSLGVPLVLETPAADDEPAATDETADANDAAMMRLLGEMAAERR